MSEPKNNKSGGGSKKIRATFGDVMLGIPSGQGGRPGEGGKKPRGDGDKGRSSERRSSETSADAAPSTEPREGKGRREGGEKRRGGPPPKKEKGPAVEKKPQGPLVVVKRATGSIETRPLDAPTPVDAPAQAPGEEPAKAAASASPAAAAPPSALFEEVPESQSFAEMFEASAREGGNQGRRHVRVGEKVSGKIFQLGAETAFISLDGKSEAMIELRELQDEEGILRYGVGDLVEAFVVETGARGTLLSKAISKGAASMAMLAEARASGIPVEGMVLSLNKGGLEVAIGDVRAFCPIGQVDVRFVEKPDKFIGEKLKFRVMEMRDKSVVVSRRSVLEDEQKALAAQTRKSLSEGAVVKGTVTSLRDFGAFVDLGGIEGLIPISELAHGRVGHPSEVVKVGDSVEVEVLKMEPPNPNSPDKAKQRERITLSMRSRQEDPWKVAMAEIQEGSTLSGKVVRLQPFGAFVELKPGVDGLIHISALSDRRIAHPRDVVKVGEEVSVRVEKIDPAEKRVGLRLVRPDEGEQGSAPSLPPLSAVVPPQGGKGRAAPAERGGGAPTSSTPAAASGEPPAPRPKVGQVVKGKVERIESYGVFLGFPGGRGLVPASETGTDRGSDLKRHFAMGQEVRAEVVEIEGGGKIRLSVTAAQRSEERADMDAWKKSQPKGGGGKGFGTFADLLTKLKKE